MSTLSSRIKIIPIESPFLPGLADHLVENFSDLLPDLSDILVILPSQRNKLYFRKYLLNASGKHGIIPPTMLTNPELIDLIFQRLGGNKGRLLKNIERNFVIKGVIDSLKIRFWENIPFLKFISIGNRLLNFYDELSQEGVSIEEIEQKKELLHFPQKYIEEELPIIKRVFYEYKNTLSKSGSIDPTHKYHLIREKFTPETLSEYTHIIIAGPAAATRLENSIIKGILDSAPSELILHSLRDEIKDDVSSPYYHHNKILSALGVKPGEVETLNTQISPPPFIEVNKVANETHETFLISSILKNLKGDHEPHRIAIVLPDEDSVYSIMESLNTSGDNFNLSMGISFTQTFLYSFLHLLKEALIRDLHYKEFFALIKHPLLKNAKTEENELRASIYRIERSMEEQNSNYFDPLKITSSDDKPFVELLKKIMASVESNLPFPDYVKGIVEMIEEVLRLNKAQYNFSGTKDFLDQLHELSKLRLPGGALGKWDEKMEFILRILKDGSYHVQGDPFSGIQVMGVLEARNLDFDCIILPDFNEGVFPKRSEKDLFVPAQLRKELGIPYDKERENLYYFYFSQLISGKKKVFISYVEDKAKRDIRSRFVDFLDGRIKDPKIAFLRETVQGPRSVKKDESILDKLTGMSLSPTALRDYVICPYRFCLKYVLKIKEPGVITEEPDARGWGMMVHKALQRFYAHDFPSGFDEAKLEDAEKALFLRLNEAMKEDFSPKASILFDLEIYKRRMIKFLQEDRKRFEEGYGIYSVEKGKPYKYDLFLDDKKVRLHGRPDRIDLRDGKYYIIDYKIGRTLPSKSYRIDEDFTPLEKTPSSIAGLKGTNQLSGREGEPLPNFLTGFTEFQLPVYALMFSQGDYKKIGGLVYYFISGDKVEITDIMEEGYLDDFQENMLIPVIHDILDADKDFCQTQDKNQCRICVYKDFCGT